MKGPNKIYSLQFDYVLLRNAGSTDPDNDGWFVDSLRKVVRIKPEMALWLLQGVRRRRLALRTLPT